MLLLDKVDQITIVSLQSIEGGNMWKPWQWASRSNELAISNARAAATACSRRRLERADAALYLASLDPAVDSTKHPA